MKDALRNVVMNPKVVVLCIVVSQLIAIARAMV